MAASGLWIVDGGQCRTRLAYVHTNLQDDKRTRAQEHTRAGGKRRKGKRKALRLERVAGGGGAWAAVCVDTRMKHSKTASATNYPTAAEIGMRHYPCCKLIGHSKHRGGGGSAGAGGYVFGFCLFAQRAGSCNNNSEGFFLVRQKGLPRSLSPIALLVCSAPAAVASLLCNVSANGVCTVFGNTLN